MSVSPLICVCVGVGVGALLGVSACGARPLELNAPILAPGRDHPAIPVELEPLVATAPASGIFAGATPSSALTTAMRGELSGRALHGVSAPPGGYTLRCTLDRFAIRSRQSIVESHELLVLYADLSCEATRTDGGVAWRGEVRGRAAAETPNVFGMAFTTQRLADRALSDAAREMVADVALRALALVGEPSARVFADDAHQLASAGLDDMPFGAAALSENPAAVEGATRALDHRDPAVRAAAWNVIAMAAGPGDAWLAGATMTLDEDPLVRFVQYKALARMGTATALDQLRMAAPGEGDSLLAEFLKDALATGGIGFARRQATGVSGR